MIDAWSLWWNIAHDVNVSLTITCHKNSKEHMMIEYEKMVMLLMNIDGGLLFLYDKMCAGCVIRNNANADSTPDPSHVCTSNPYNSEDTHVPIVKYKQKKKLNNQTQVKKNDPILFSKWKNPTHNEDKW